MFSIPLAANGTLSLFGSVILAHAQIPVMVSESRYTCRWVTPRLGQTTGSWGAQHCHSLWLTAVPRAEGMLAHLLWSFPGSLSSTDLWLKDFLNQRLSDSETGSFY